MVTSPKVSEGDVLWRPTDDSMARSRLTAYMTWLRAEGIVGADTYDDLWRWSVADLPAFWSSICRYFGVEMSKPATQVLSGFAMPGATWFDGAELSLVSHVFANAHPTRPALLFRSERVARREVSWPELERAVASVAASLAAMGVRKGDRVASFMPNVPETVIAFLATASIGAIWSSCSPDFGAAAVVDRFQQIEPTVLFAVPGYRYGGRDFDCRPVVERIVRDLPGLAHVVLVPEEGRPEDETGFAFDVVSVHSWDEVAGGSAVLRPAQLPFSHPLWVVYTSGTTGLPKPIVHSQGGILLESLKHVGLHLDIGPDDRFFWYTTSGWIMWNILLGGLMTGATLVLYDGSPGHQELDALWLLAEDFELTVLGTSAAFITASMKAGKSPGRTRKLAHLRTVGSTGSPLAPEGFAWIYEHVGREIWVASISGGTDVATAFLSGSPLLPVTAGELQCRCLGVDAHAFDESGAPVIEQVGELVIREPMPSMPISFWNDPGDRRYRESYFEMYPGFWRHGDWVRVTDRGTAVVYGRSDSTINRQGIRVGTSELYRVVEAMPEIADSLAIDVQHGDGGSLILFVVLAAGAQLDEQLRRRIALSIRTALSPRHVPDDVLAITSVPRTLNGKKLEVPVKRILLGESADRVVSRDAMVNPESLQAFESLALRFAPGGSGAA